MPIVSVRHALVALFVVPACAIVAACGQSQTDDAGATQSASASGRNTPQAYQANQVQRSELQDWAREATSAESPHAGQITPASHAAVARASSDALATPVIHTVD
jgi:hypothetical protein